MIRISSGDTNLWKNTRSREILVEQPNKFSLLVSLLTLYYILASWPAENMKDFFTSFSPLFDSMKHIISASKTASHVYIKKKKQNLQIISNFAMRTGGWMTVWHENINIYIILLKGDQIHVVTHFWIRDLSIYMSTSTYKNMLTIRLNASYTDNCKDKFSNEKSDQSPTQQGSIILFKGGFSLDNI